MSNAVKVYTIGGDFYAEIIKDGGKLINLKPLNPATIKIIANDGGIITGYEQISKGAITKKPLHSWKPEEIFHLS